MILGDWEDIEMESGIGFKHHKKTKMNSLKKGKKQLK